MRRYIDANALKKEIKKSAEVVTDNWNWYGISVSKAITLVEDAPTANVVERKKGKWIVIMNEPNITFDECKCSECGVVEYFNKGWKKFDFCPNCGAEMEANDGEIY